MAAVFAGKRVAGDFYDCVRVSSERVLFGLFDVAGRREDNRGILAAAQQIFRSFGTELSSRSGINESEAMPELGLRINRGLIETSPWHPALPRIHRLLSGTFGTLYYSNAGHTPGVLRGIRGRLSPG